MAKKKFFQRQQPSDLAHAGSVEVALSPSEPLPGLALLDPRLADTNVVPVRPSGHFIRREYDADGTLKA